MRASKSGRALNAEEPSKVQKTAGALDEPLSVFTHADCVGFARVLPKFRELSVPECALSIPDGWKQSFSLYGT